MTEKQIDPRILSEEQLQAIATLEAAATPGPWQFSEEPKIGASLIEFEQGVSFKLIATLGHEDKEDAAFILAARTAVPSLLSMVRALHEQNAVIETETIERLRREVWAIGLKLTVELEYAKGREKTLLTGKYEGIKAVWELLGGDKKEVAPMSKSPAAIEAKKRNLTEGEKADGWLLLRKMATVLAKNHKLTEGEQVTLQHILTGEKWTIGGKKARDEVAKKMRFKSTEDLKRAVIENLACHVVGFARKAGYEVNPGDDMVMFVRYEEDDEEEGDDRD